MAIELIYKGASTGGAVKSVNGKTGAVVLTADDVGAASKGYVDSAIAGISISASGLSADMISALDNMFKVCAFIKDDVSTEYNAFKSAFGIDSDSGSEEEPSTPGDTEKTLVSISATYTGGDVYTTATIADLTGITVIATYSDGSTATITDYTLSGEIKEGSNTITVSYGGMTTTFTVVAFVNDSGDESNGNDAPFDTITWTDGLRLSGNKEYTGHGNYDTCDYADITGINAITITIKEETPTGNIQYNYAFYSSNTNDSYVDGGNGYMNNNNTSYPNTITIDVPEGAVYCRICGTKLSSVSFNNNVYITVS